MRHLVVGLVTLIGLGLSASTVAPAGEVVVLVALGAIVWSLRFV